MINIILLGLVSFFSDISAEMVYPILPLYLTATFGVTPAIIGLIEGIAESLASLLKVFSGYYTDRFQKKKRVAFLGYSTGVIYKLILFFAQSWSGILFARGLDRIGKGIRTAPRDVMICESADKENIGRAFGIHKALDMAGSACGILIAYLLLVKATGFDYHQLFLVSIIPALIGLSLFFLIQEKEKVCSLQAKEPFWKHMRELDPPLKLYLLVAFVFTLGNSSNAFLLLRAKNVGFTDTSVILLYFLYNITASILAVPLAKLSDRIGRKKLLVTGYLVFSLVYLLFAVAGNQAWIVSAFVIYGLYTALIVGVERAFIAEISPVMLKGTMLGLHATIVGIALLPASAIAGLLWNLFGVQMPFLFGAFMSLTAALVLLFFLQDKKRMIPK